MADRPSDQDQLSLAQGVSEFSLDLYKSLASSNTENLSLSPLSVHVLLTALSSATDHETKVELRAALGLNELTAIDGLYSSLLQKLASVPQSEGQPLYELVLANAAWLKKEYAVNPAFLDSLRKNYSADISTVDFSNKSSAASLINQWVSKKTKGKIEDLLNESAIDSLTRLILTNAVYFKSRWANQFSPQVTSSQAFYVSKDETIRVPLMNDLQHIPYFENEIAQFIALPYEGHSLYFLAALPFRKNGLHELEKKLTHKELQSVFSNLATTKVDYHLPRFLVNSRFELKDFLRSLGMARVFDFEQCSFPGISEQENLAISSVLQESFISVDEQGTEAAAATAVMLAGSAYVPEPPKVFRADHPFMFFIFHRETNAVIFLGRIARPSQTS